MASFLLFKVKSNFKMSFIGVLLWLILLVICWPLAILLIILYPLIWLLLLPFKIIGIAIGAVLELVRALLFLPFRILRI